MTNEIKKKFMIDYFKKLLNNDLTLFTENWINDNYERLEKIEEDSPYPITPDALWCYYQDYFQNKYNLGMWHKVMPYNDIYNIYIDMGFSEALANSYAKKVRYHMDEYERDNTYICWAHEPNIFYWLKLPTL